MSLKPLAVIEIDGDGLVVHHNMPCAVCGKKHAVYVSNNGIFLPCWGCQRKGYKLIRTDHKKIMGFFEWFDLFKSI